MFNYMVLEMKIDRNNTAGAKALAVVFLWEILGAGKIGWRILGLVGIG